MGYGGKVEERRRARELRARSWTLQEIADELGVSKGSVSVWVRDVDFEPRSRRRGHPPGESHPLRVRKRAELDRCAREAEALIGCLSNRDLMMFALALYAGEGAKEDCHLRFANTDPRLSLLFLTWLRRAFDIDESRLRVVLYLHADLDLDEAIQHWSGITGIPREQFRKPYRAVVDETRRTNRHVFGCATVIYSCCLTHRRVMAMIAAVTSSVALPG